MAKIIKRLPRLTLVNEDDQSKKRYLNVSHVKNSLTELKIIASSTKSIEKVLEHILNLEAEIDGGIE